MSQIITSGVCVIEKSILRLSRLLGQLVRVMGLVVVGEDVLEVCSERHVCCRRGVVEGVFVCVVEGCLVCVCVSLNMGPPLSLYTPPSDTN